MAAIQGIDLNESSQETETESDITELKGFLAQEAGFGINMGIGHFGVDG